MPDGSLEASRGAKRQRPHEASQTAPVDRATLTYDSLYEDNVCLSEVLEASNEFLNFAPTNRYPDEARYLNATALLASLQDFTQGLKLQMLEVNAALIEKIPNRSEREPIMASIKIMCDMMVFRALCHYEASARFVRVEEPRAAALRKSESVKKIVFEVIDDFIKTRGKRPRCKEVGALVREKLENTDVPHAFSDNQIARQFTAWQKAHPR